VSPYAPYQAEQIARAEQWLPAVYAQVPEVTSADKAYAWMRANDLYVPRAYVRETWSAIIRGQDYVSIANRLPDEALVPRDWMQESIFHYEHQYIYIVKTEGKDSYTGLRRTDYVTVESDESLTIGEIQATAAGQAFDYGTMIFADDFVVELDTIKRSA